MADEPTGQRYTKVAIGLHWMIAALIILGVRRQYTSGGTIASLD